MEDKELTEAIHMMPVWETHLTLFKQKHPKMSALDAEEKAGFTFRMRKAKIVQKYIQKLMNKIKARDTGFKQITAGDSESSHRKNCDEALKHYTNLSDACYVFNGVVVDAINYFREYGG